MHNKDKLLASGIYKNPNCDAENHERLNRLVTQAVDMKYKNTVIIGDFNSPEINSETWTVNKSETHPAFHFVEGVRSTHRLIHTI